MNTYFMWKPFSYRCQSTVNKDEDFFYIIQSYLYLSWYFLAYYVQLVNLILKCYFFRLLECDSLFYLNLDIVLLSSCGGCVKFLDTL